MAEEATERGEWTRVLAFLLWGGVNTTSSFAVYSLLIFIGLPISLASLFSLIAGILLGHLFGKNNVFRSRRTGTLPRYVLIWAIIYCFNLFLIYRFVASGLDPYLAGALATLLLVPVSYLLQRFVVFGR